MTRCIARRVFVVKLAVMAMGASCFLPTHVHAQGMPGYLVIFPSVGLAPGETLRLTLFHPAGTPVRARAQLHHSGGILVALADGSVRGGAFRSFDFQRSDISLAGEAGTGRLQLRASLFIETTRARGKVDGLAVAMETVSITDGTSSTIMIGEARLPPAAGSGAGAGNLVGRPLRNVLLGIVPGQTLRVNLFNPPSFESEAGSAVGGQAQRKPVDGHVKIFDTSGNLIAQSDELVIPPGEFRSFDFDRIALSLPGEVGTDRQQVRVSPSFELASRRPSRVLASFEIVDDSTGKTEVLAGQECLVFYLGGVPADR